MTHIDFLRFISGRHYSPSDASRENSLCLLLKPKLFLVHQSIPPALSPPRVDPRALAFFLPWMAKLSYQIPRGGDEKRGQMPRPPSTLQHFPLIAQSNSAILSILM